MILLFCLILFLILIHYFFFPLSVFLISLVYKRPHEIHDITPSVSLIIAAYNEAQVIQSKLESSAHLDYPADKLEIIVVSDGSSDETPNLVASFVTRKVVNLFSPERRGKTHAINRAVEKASGEIILFSDANTFYDRDAIRMLVRNFADLSVGAVSGRKTILKQEERESSSGDNLFWEFESRLKERESLIGSIPTGDGEIFAVRKALYRPIPPEIINDDMAITLNVVLAGSRVIYEKRAISKEAASPSLEDDFKVKARMVAGGYQILSAYRKIFFPPNWFSFQLLVHKGLRYLMPLLLIALFLTSMLLPEYLLIQIFLALQSAFYGAALAAWLLRLRNFRPGPLYVPLYYCAMNTAALVGLYYFFTGKSVTRIWSKAQR